MRLVILGYGYSSRAIRQALGDRPESVVVTTTKPEKATSLREQGLETLVFDGTTGLAELQDALASATHLIASAGPGPEGDPFLPHLDLTTAPDLAWIGYLSTVGVYGDAQGGWVDETTEPKPLSARSKTRLSVERDWMAAGAACGAKVGVFRLAGIYGPGRSPLDRVRNGTARRIIKAGQVFNRIHVADIGRVVAAAALGKDDGVFNVSDDEPCPPQDVIELAAQLLRLEPPPAIPFEEADLSPMARSFYGETKRVSNALIKERFGPMLYPTYREGLASLQG